MYLIGPNILETIKYKYILFYFKIGYKIIPGIKKLDSRIPISSYYVINCKADKQTKI